MVKISASFQKTNNLNLGTLYVVATPIGNREDITLRAIKILTTVDSILAEDTRHSMLLLRELRISKPLISFHAHNENQKCQEILQALLSGKTFALISDAGTPLISDPGFPLVTLAREHGVPVVPIPGPSAFIAALSAAGVPCQSFSFQGFLPAKKPLRQAALKSSHPIVQTLIYYESAHRIIHCVKDIHSIFGEDYSFIVAKELTKLFETFIEGTALEILAFLTSDPNHAKGEFIVILPPQVQKIKEVEDEEKAIALLKLLLSEMPLSKAVDVVTTFTKCHKNRVYQLALSLKK